jgi:lipid-binding SYLF domain-containing protein
MRAEILSYSRARGLFAGVSLAGSTVRPDGNANEKVYGRKLPAKDIALSGATSVPPSAHEMIATLNTRTPKHKA